MADIEKVRLGIGSDPRIGYSFIYPGAGYGGSCFPKDVRALVHTATQSGYQAGILNAVEAVNEKQRRKLFELLEQHFDGSLSGRRIAVWGLSFKPNTDDIREAPAITLIKWITSHGGKVVAFDRVAAENTKAELGDRVEIAEDMYGCLAGCDALVICTDWDEFKNPDFGEIKAKMNAPTIFDGRNLHRPGSMKERGYTYYSVGRAPVSP